MLDNIVVILLILLQYHSALTGVNVRAPVTVERAAPHMSTAKSQAITKDADAVEIGDKAKLLLQYAKQFRSLGKRMLGDVVEIGRILTEAKVVCGYGNFLPWLDHEFGWTDRTARNFMRVYELSKTSVNFSDLDLPVSAVYLLAAPSTPDKVRQAVIAEAEAGKAVTVKDVKRTIDDDRAPFATPQTAPTESVDDQAPWPTTVPVVIEPVYGPGDDRAHEDVEPPAEQVEATGDAGLSDADDDAAAEYHSRFTPAHKPKPSVQSPELTAALARAEKAEKRVELFDQHERELKNRYADVIALTKEKKALLAQIDALNAEMAAAQGQRRGARTTRAGSAGPRADPSARGIVERKPATARPRCRSGSSDP
jgi:hypothetical protein